MFFNIAVMHQELFVKEKVARRSDRWISSLEAFGWLKVCKERKSLVLRIFGGTDNRSNEALTRKRATTKWPLMAINVQLSSALSKSRLSLLLQWRPREENVEADDLTNEKFSSFQPACRVQIKFQDLDLALLNSLVEARGEFEEKKAKARSLASSLRVTGSKEV